MEVFELQKLATAFLAPLGFCILLTLLGLALGRRWLVLVAMAWLWLWSSPAWVQHVAERMEAGHALQLPAALPEADVILVLGGALSPGIPNWHPDINLGSAADRILFAAELYRLGKAPRLLFTGGPINYLDGSEAQSAAEILQRLGVPASAITLERASRTTRENASLSMPLLAELGAKRVLFVTSALHLPRAMGNFRALAADSGLDITFIAAPCDPAELVEAIDPVMRYLPTAESLKLSAMIFKELLGSLHAALFGGGNR